MLSLETIDTFPIPDLGIVYLVSIPDDFLAERDPRTLRGEIVELDGEQVKVVGVEAHAVTWTPGLAALKNVGLLVAVPDD